MKYFEMFAGVGGFGLGINNAYDNIRNQGEREQPTSEREQTTGDVVHTETNGAICVGYSEIDKYASQVLKYHYPTIKNYGDCTKINWADVPDFDILTGGSPCQDFSIAGKRKGIVGERSGLVWEFIRALEEKKPEYFIWENVKGVLSSRRGFDLGNIITAFSEAGYSLWWQVLNAKDFGVPQNRERIFVVGTRNRSPREVFFEPRADGKDIQVANKGASQHYRTYDEGGVAPTLQSQSGWSSQKHPFIINMHISARNPNRKNAAGGVADHLSATKNPLR